MGKAERRVSLTKEEIRALCEEAADKAVERSEKARKKSIAQEKKTLLYNTKKLLENSITDEQLNILIEAAVKQMKMEENAGIVIEAVDEPTTKTE